MTSYGIMIIVMKAANYQIKARGQIPPRVRISASLVLLAAGMLHAQPCEWEALAGGGFTNNVFALSVFDFGTGPALYVGGNFRESNGNPGQHIASWDGRAWSPLGRGVGSPVLDLSVYDDGNGPALYAGGVFIRAGEEPNANGIARWDGATWTTLGSGMFNPGIWPHAVAAMQVYDDGSGPALYVGGSFTEAGGVPALNVAKWDGKQWSALGDGIAGFMVRDLLVFDDGSGTALYASGATEPGIVRWDGTSWTEFGGGVNNIANRMAIFDDGTGPALYTAGQFRNAGGVPANRIACWDGTNWSALGEGTSSEVWALGVFDDGAGPQLYVGGAFFSAGGLPVRGIARWDGSNWSPMGSGLTGFPGGPNVFAFETFDDGSGPALYTGGAFVDAGGVAVENIARWRCKTSCYADCDKSTGVGVLDIFDFLCFQDSFVSSEPYACDCDTSTGQGVCDIFDFLCFQKAFVAGCE